MASMGDMPDVPRNKISFCARHISLVKTAFFAPEKLNIGLFQRPKSAIICSISTTSRGPTPRTISFPLIFSEEKYDYNSN